MPCTLWHDEHCHLALAHRHVVEALLLVGDGRWHVRAGQLLAVLARISVGPSAAVDAVAVDARDVAVLVLAAVPERVLAAVVAGRGTAALALGGRHGSNCIGFTFSGSLACASPGPWHDSQPCCAIGSERVALEAMLALVDPRAEAFVADDAGVRARVPPAPAPPVRPRSAPAAAAGRARSPRPPETAPVRERRPPAPPTRLPLPAPRSRAPRPTVERTD